MMRVGSFPTMATIFICSEAETTLSASIVIPPLNVKIKKWKRGEPKAFLKFNKLNFFIKIFRVHHPWNCFKSPGK